MPAAAASGPLPTTREPCDARTDSRGVSSTTLRWRSPLSTNPTGGHASFESPVAALIVAKAHKVGERLRDAPGRAQAKDAHDLYRLLVSTKTGALAATLAELRKHEMAGDATLAAVAYLTAWFADPGSAGAVLAGEAEAGVGDPAQVATATSFMVRDLLDALGKLRR